MKERMIMDDNKNKQSVLWQLVNIKQEFERVRDTTTQTASAMDQVKGQMMETLRDQVAKRLIDLGHLSEDDVAKAVEVLPPVSAGHQALANRYGKVRAMLEDDDESEDDE